MLALAGASAADLGGILRGLRDAIWLCTRGGWARRTACRFVTDGPYAETQEVLAGYWIVECDSFDRATEIAGRLAECPAPERVRANAYADVRPIMESAAEIPECI